MRRLLPLVALIAVAALGVAWKLRAEDPDTTVDRVETDQGANGPEDADLQLASAGGARTSLDPTGRTSWTVYARKTDGLPAEGASIVARQDATTLEGTTTAEWKDVSPGLWRVVVTDDEGRRIERRVTVPEGADPHKTYVVLGLPATVRGSVKNSRGEVMNAHMVAFLRSDEFPPATAGELRELVSGVTGISGRFEATLPETGFWRPVVVYGGKVVYEGSPEEILPDGLVRQCDIVVPARPRLILEFTGEGPHAPDGAAAAVSVYRRPTAEDLARDQQIEAARQAQIDAGPVQEDLDDPDRAGELAKAREAENDPARLEQLAKQAVWRTVVPEGYRNVASSVVPESGRVVFDHLVHDLEYRIALRRGDEVFSLADPIFLPFGGVVLLELSPPPLPPAGTAVPIQVSVCPALSRVLTENDKVDPIGVTWR